MRFVSPPHGMSQGEWRWATLHHWTGWHWAAARATAATWAKWRREAERARERTG